MFFKKNKKYIIFKAQEKELEDALNIALEAGYRHIDTATSYENEKVIGDVLKNWFDSKKLKRSDIFIVTKVILTIIHYIICPYL